MLKVRNQKCIRRLSYKAVLASRRRNLIAIFSIILTTVLFTALFAITMSINASYETNQFRQLGGYCHGTFKAVTDEQMAAIAAHSSVKETGERRLTGIYDEGIFAKIPVEISFMDANCTKWSYAVPQVGRMPETGREIAMDTKAIQKLGVVPELGAEITLTYRVYNQNEIGLYQTDTFTLVGYWTYDELMPVHYLNVCEDYVDEMERKYTEVGMAQFRSDLNVMMVSSINIESQMKQVDTDLGYTWESRGAENSAQIGVNWAYLSAQVTSRMDPAMLMSVVAFILLTAFTGYLIIYNIFQISVAGDIHFYGLLKTIGTTPRQIKRIIRYQALVLCIVGIPVGILLGYGLSVGLMPIVLRGSTINRESMTISSSPIIFIGSALFALLTVLISCARPGRIASRVSPVEAVKYTDVNHIKKRERAVRGVKVYQMAFANLGRSKRKTVLVIVSLALAVTLLNELYAFVAGFDEDKYMSSNTCADFIVSSTDYFRYHRSDTYISESTIREIKANTDAALGGCGYIRTNGAAYMGMEEEVIRRRYKEHLEDAYVDIEIDSMEKKDGLLLGRVDIEGLDSALFDKLSVVEGDLSMMFDQDSHAVAVRVKEDAYGNIENRADYPKIGDKLTIEYTTGVKDTNSLEINHEIESYEVEYTVCALVFMPNTMSFRTQAIEGEYLIMPVERLRADGGQHVIPMFYLFDAADDNAEKAAENYLSQQTDQGLSTLMYESKATIQEEFRQFQRMFILLGSLLCVIVGMVGILNFFNAIMTGLLSRRKEFAVLQSIGMTNRQLRRMLIYEGMFYALGAIAVALALALGIGPLIGHSMNKIFFFYQYQFSIMPVLAVVPSFVLLGCLIPAVLYGQSSRQSIVERLRDYF